MLSPAMAWARRSLLFAVLLVAGAVLLLSPPVPRVEAAPPSFETASSASVNDTSPLTLDKPASLALNDVMLAQISFGGGTGTTITPPSGWTLVRRDDSGTLFGQAI